MITKIVFKKIGNELEAERSNTFIAKPEIDHHCQK